MVKVVTDMPVKIGVRKFWSRAVKPTALLVSALPMSSDVPIMR